MAMNISDKDGHEGRLLTPEKVTAITEDIEALQGDYPIFPHRELAWAVAKAQDMETIALERERIHNYIQVLVRSNDLKINDGILLWNIIQDTLPLKYMQVPLAVQMLMEKE